MNNGDIIWIILAMILLGIVFSSVRPRAARKLAVKLSGIIIRMLIVAFFLFFLIPDMVQWLLVSVGFATVYEFADWMVEKMEKRWAP